MADHLQTDFFPLGSGTLVSCGWSGPTCRCPWLLWAWSRPRVLFLPQSCSTKAGSTVCLPGICSVAVPRIRISPSQKEEEEEELAMVCKGMVIYISRQQSANGKSPGPGCSQNSKSPCYHTSISIPLPPIGDRFPWDFISV